MGSTAAVRGSQTRPSLRSARVLLRLVQFEHTIFALPFAYAGAVMAAHGFPGWARLLWVTVAMASARTCAFALNRLVDREIDSRNPRTALRPSVTGEVSAVTMTQLAIVSGCLLLLAAGELNWLCMAMAPIALALFVAYPYCKRFTAAAHFVLGAAIAGAPVGGWLAVTGRWQPGAVLLGLTVLTWMGGLDILYALQDIEVDRTQGLHSVPARFSLPTAFLISDTSHVLTAALLVLSGVVAGVSWPFFVAAAAAIALLAYEHTLVSPRDFSRVNRAFFTVNSYFAVVVFAGAVAAAAVH